MNDLSTRIKSLEGIRGFAALIVFLSHFGVMFYPAFYWGGQISQTYSLDVKFGQSPFQLLANGNAGVVLFLFITGFGSYRVYVKGREVTRRYLILRYIKLLVLTLISAILVFLLANFGAIYYKNAAAITNTPWLGEFDPKTLNFMTLLLVKPLESMSAYNSVLWTMKYMYMGSLVSIMISFLLANRSRKYKLIVILIAVVISLNIDQIYIIPCILGTLIADSKASNIRYTNSKGIILLMVVIGIYLLGYPTYDGLELSTVWYSYLPRMGDYNAIKYHIIGGAIVFWACINNIFVERIMNLRILQILGKYSADIYITHLAVIVSFSSWEFSYLILNRHDYNSSCLIVFLSTAIVVAISSIVMHNILKNVFVWMDKWYDKLDSIG